MSYYYEAVFATEHALVVSDAPLSDSVLYNLLMFHVSPELETVNELSAAYLRGNLNQFSACYQLNLCVDMTKTLVSRVECPEVLDDRDRLTEILSFFTKLPEKDRAEVLRTLEMLA